jgi:hypothetical protein
MLGQVAQEAVHAREIGAVDQVSALLFDRHKAGVSQFFKMKGQGVARYIQMISQDAGREAFRASDDQSTKGPQTLGVGQGRQ